MVSIAELLLLVLALGPFGSRAGAREGMSTLLFTIPEHNLYPENVAFDPRSGDCFLGSMGRGRFLGTLTLPARFKPIVWRRDAGYRRWLHELDRAYVMKVVRRGEGLPGDS